MAVANKEVSLSSDKNKIGNFVSMDQHMVKAPGHLPSGFGRELNINMFHGGTIFWNASSKVIHVKNQVSFGAGETLAAKLKFEEWPWEVAITKVRRYHSENSILVAEEFKQ